MEPNLIYALLLHEVDKQARPEQLERYFAVRAEASQRRRRRIQRLRQRLIIRRAPRLSTQSAV